MAVVTEQDVTVDPILGLRDASAAWQVFRDTIASAVARHPAIGEATAAVEEARAARGEARAAEFPSGTVTISNYQVLSRAFSDDPQNIIERSRSRRRTDASLSLQQTLFDFGATENRIRAAGARLQAADAQTASTADQIALRSIAIWYDVFADRALASLAVRHAISQRELRKGVAERVARGVAASGDLALVDGYIGSADRSAAEITRSLAQSEARFVELIGGPPPSRLMRAPPANTPMVTREFVEDAALKGPVVVAANAAAKASRYDAQSARASNYPSITVGLDAGRYGALENPQDYDVRGNITLRQRLFGGMQSRENQADARARSAEARATRVRVETVRDASIAWSDVQALQTELSAIESSYVSTRNSRDILLERFNASRGTLFDILSANDNLFQAAATFVRTLSELDTARYALLSKTGRLLNTLEIETGREQMR